MSRTTSAPQLQGSRNPAWQPDLATEQSHLLSSCSGPAPCTGSSRVSYGHSELIPLAPLSGGVSKIEMLLGWYAPASDLSAKAAAAFPNLACRVMSAPSYRTFV